MSRPLSRPVVPTDHPNYDPLLATQAAADYIGVAPDTLAQMARSREIGCVRQSEAKGSPTKFRLSALNNWIRAHEIKPLRTAASA